MMKHKQENHLQTLSLSICKILRKLDRMMSHLGIWLSLTRCQKQIRGRHASQLPKLPKYGLGNTLWLMSGANSFPVCIG